MRESWVLNPCALFPVHVLVLVTASLKSLVSMKSDAGNVIRRATRADWDDEQRALLPGSEQLEQVSMRSLLTLGLLISLTAYASAATIHGPHTRHRAVAHHGQVVSSGDFVVPREAYAAPRPPIYYNDTPSYNDPSKFGGQSLGMDP